MFLIHYISRFDESVIENKNLRNCGVTFREYRVIRKDKRFFLFEIPWKPINMNLHKL